MYVYECNFAITLQNLSAQFNLRLTSHHDETKSVELVVTPQSLGRTLQDLRPATSLFKYCICNKVSHIENFVKKKYLQANHLHALNCLDQDGSSPSFLRLGDHWFEH